MIPLLDLRAQYASIKGEIDAAIGAVLGDCQFHKGPHLKAFEDAFSAYIGAGYCIGTANCTDALYLCLRSLNIGSGDEVIVPAMTFIATAEAVTLTGATPVFVDIEHGSCNIDIDKAAAAVTDKTMAIIPVHLSGRAVDMVRLCRMANGPGLFVIEDCAQAAGAEWDGQSVGTWGNAGCFSFYPSKNLGAYGDGGAVVTNTDFLAYRVRTLADHGQFDKSTHHSEGICSRLDALQAAILNAKLAHLDAWNAKRRAWAIAYDDRLSAIPGIGLPNIPDDPASHVFHCYVVRVKNRDAVRARLAEKGIATGVHYQEALPLMRAYARFGHTAGEFPEAYAYANECLSLPMYPELTTDQIDYIAASLTEAVHA